MAQLPFPLTATDLDDLKFQLWEILRQVYEEKIGGAELGDVFSIPGEVLTLVVKDSGGLTKSGNELALELRPGGGLQLTSTGIGVTASYAWQTEPTFRTLYDTTEVSTTQIAWITLKTGEWFYKSNGWPSKIIGTFEGKRDSTGAGTAARPKVSSVEGSQIDCNELVYTQKSFSLDISSLADDTWYQFSMQGSSSNIAVTHYQQNHYIRMA